MAITLERATEADLPRLAELHRLAYMHDLAAMCAFTNWPAEKEMYQFFADVIKPTLHDPNTIVTKALSIETGEILGFMTLVFNDGSENLQAPAQATPAPTNSTVQNESSCLKADFVEISTREVKRLKSYMKGKKHYCK